MTLSVKAGGATRDPGHIGRLFAHRAERLAGEYDAGFGIDMIRLAAAVTSPLDAGQSAIFAAPDGAADLDRLYDRMASRLGAGAIERAKLVDAHIPERAVRFEPVLARTPDDPLGTPALPLPRPLRLLPRPEPVEVMMAEVPDGPPRAMVWRRVRYVFRKARGPERIAAEWWTAAAPPASTRRVPEENTRMDPPDHAEVDTIDAMLERRAHLVSGADFSPGEAAEQEQGALPPKPFFDADAATRDYFVAEDDGGRRFWLFRQGLYVRDANPGWFLHGFFA
jgi:protein ImuB